MLAPPAAEVFRRAYEEDDIGLRGSCKSGSDPSPVRHKAFQNLANSVKQIDFEEESDSNEDSYSEEDSDSDFGASSGAGMSVERSHSIHNRASQDQAPACPQALVRCVLGTSHRPLSSSE